MADNDPKDTIATPVSTVHKMAQLLEISNEMAVRLQAQEQKQAAVTELANTVFERLAAQGVWQPSMKTAAIAALSDPVQALHYFNEYVQLSGQSLQKVSKTASASDDLGQGFGEPQNEQSSAERQLADLDRALNRLRGA